MYGQPVVSGNYTVITASDVAAGGGFGFGISFGPMMGPAVKRSDEETPQSQQTHSVGGGGGGGSSGRPVALIIIGPERVTVKPVYDVTKVALAGLTAIGAMLVMFSKILKASRR